jgi:hypothetical protein
VFVHLANNVPVIPLSDEEDLEIVVKVGLHFLKGLLDLLRFGFDIVDEDVLLEDR